MRRCPGSPLRARRVRRRGARTGSTSWSALSLSRSVEAPPAGGAPRRPQLLDGPAQQALGPGLRPRSCSMQARRGRAARLPGASQLERFGQPQPLREPPTRPQFLDGPAQHVLGPGLQPRSCSMQARRGRPARLPGASQLERFGQPQPSWSAGEPQLLNGPVQQALGPSCGPRSAASRPGVGALALVGRRAAAADGAGSAVAARRGVGHPGRGRRAPMLSGSVGRVAVRATPSASGRGRRWGAVLATRPGGRRASVTSTIADAQAEPAPGCASNASAVG